MSRGAGGGLLRRQYDTSVPKYGVKTMAPVPASGMLIGAFAAAVGVGIETVRYYERRGLLQTSVAERGRGRRYGASAVSRLTFIKAAQDLGFSLDEVRAAAVERWTPLPRDAVLGGVQAARRAGET